MSNMGKVLIDGCLYAVHYFYFSVTNGKMCICSNVSCISIANVTEFV